MTRGARARARRTAVLVACVLGVLGCAAAAQPITTTGTNMASVDLSGRVELIPLTSLRLPLTELTFDLTSSAAAPPDCVVGSAQLDVPLPTSTFQQPAVAPAGTSLHVQTFPNVTISGGQPANMGDLPSSDPALVCYRTFVLEAFSNRPNWQLTIDRLEAPAATQLRTLYVGAACKGEEDLAIFSLATQETALLTRPSSSADCREVLVAVAIKPALESAGSSATVLRYTLVAPGEGFEEP